MSKPLAVVAVGGNALIADDKRNSIDEQYACVTDSVRYLCDMIEVGWEMLLTHGNGPQVGFILRRSEISRSEVSPVPSTTRWVIRRERLVICSRKRSK